MSKKEAPPPVHSHWLPLSILLSGVMIAGAILYTQWPERSPSSEGASAPPAASTPPRPAPPEEPREIWVNIAEAPRRGRPTARLTLIEFSDYQ